MKTKIYVGRDLIGRFTCDGKKLTRWQIAKLRAIRAMKNTLAIASFVVIGGWLFTAGAILATRTIAPDIVKAKEIIEVPVKEVPPILKKIAKCESGGSHYDKNGQVLINETRDVGAYQINVPIWGKTAKEMDIDLFDEKDNEVFAIWLFDNYGSVPWIHSSSCWNK